MLNSPERKSSETRLGWDSEPLVEKLDAALEIATLILTRVTETNAAGGSTLALTRETADIAVEISAAVDSSGTETLQALDRGAELSALLARNQSEMLAQVRSSHALGAEVDKFVREFEQSFATINSVTKKIGKLAQQTNLVALNAAIEAARSGDAGRGFSVVANEIKNLARESEKSAESISEMARSLTVGSKNLTARIDDLGGNLNQTCAKVEENGAVQTEMLSQMTAAHYNAQDMVVRNGQQHSRFEFVSSRLEKITGNAQKSVENTERNMLVLKQLIDILRDLREQVS